MQPTVSNGRQAPEGYQWKTRKPVLPLYLGGCGFALYACLAPFYTWWHLLLGVLVGGACFGITRLICRPVDYLIPLPDVPEPAPPPPEPTVSSSLSKEAQSYLSQMREADVAIADETVSEKIRALETQTQKIFCVVAEQPAKEPEIRKLMTYYLPMLLKLLRSYDRLEDRGIRSGNIGKSMEQISGALDMAIVAFERQLDNLFQNEAMDISSDITVLESLMQQEGLTQESPWQADAHDKQEER